MVVTNINVDVDAIKLVLKNIKIVKQMVIKYNLNYKVLINDTRITIKIFLATKKVVINTRIVRVSASRLKTTRCSIITKLMTTKNMWLFSMKRIEQFQ